MQNIHFKVASIFSDALKGRRDIRNVIYRRFYLIKSQVLEPLSKQVPLRVLMKMGNMHDDEMFYVITTNSDLLTGIEVHVHCDYAKKKGNIDISLSTISGKDESLSNTTIVGGEVTINIPKRDDKEKVTLH